MKKVIMFSASWCNPCKQVKPRFIQLAEEKKSVSFEVIDIDENKEQTESAGITSVPTFIIYENNIEKTRLVGSAFIKDLALMLGGE